MMPPLMMYCMEGSMPSMDSACLLYTSSGYPKCLLCPENVGYAGTISHPARQNLRVMPVMVNGQPWGFQYSPYVYSVSYTHLAPDTEEDFEVQNDYIRQAVADGADAVSYTHLDVYKRQLLISPRIDKSCILRYPNRTSTTNTVKEAYHGTLGLPGLPADLCADRGDVYKRQLGEDDVVMLTADHGCDPS